MRPHAATLATALLGAATAPQLLETLHQPELALRLPEALSVDDLLTLADHEAALRKHPYLGPEHVVLSASRICDDTTLYRRISSGLPDGLPRRGLRGWRPRGRHSMARPRGLQRLEAEQQEAQQRERDGSRLDGAGGDDASQ